MSSPTLPAIPWWYRALNHLIAPLIAGATFILGTMVLATCLQQGQMGSFHVQQFTCVVHGLALVISGFWLGYKNQRGILRGGLHGLLYWGFVCLARTYWFEQSSQLLSEGLLFACFSFSAGGFGGLVGECCRKWRLGYLARRIKITDSAPPAA